MLKRSLRLFLLGFYVVTSVANAQKVSQRPVDLVYPQLDAANSRWFFFSSASRPFGLVSLFPDNVVSGDWHGGYRYHDTVIRSISHIHEWQLSGVAVMPVRFDYAHIKEIFDDYSSPFSHQNEMVKPGYHQFVLKRYGVKGELTASNRVGYHRYLWPAKGSRGMLFSLSGVLGPSKISSGGYRWVSPSEIRGFVVNAPTERRPKPVTVYFTAVFNMPIKQIHLERNGEVVQAHEWRGGDGNMIVDFGEKTNSLEMKVGISFTSEAGAASNLKGEIPGWGFDNIRLKAESHWNDMLGRIQIEGGSLKQQRRFYTDLWHAIQGRRMVSDLNGRYVDNTGAVSVVKQVPLRNGRPLFNMYNSDAFWGAEWTLNTLWDLVYPEITDDFCRSFLQYYRDGGLIPRGPSGGNYTYVMTGAQTTPFYVSAWQKGIRGFDIQTAYEGLRKNHFPGGMMGHAGYEHHSAQGGGIEEYIKLGFVPYPLSEQKLGLHMDGAAITLQNAFQDWSLAQLAKAIGKKTDYRLFMKRSENYRHLYHAQLNYMVPRDRAGKWRSPFDPLEYEHGFEEGNGTQYTWYVPHALDSLFKLMGGRAIATERLNKQFEDSRKFHFSSEFQGNPDSIVKLQRVAINYGNQPSIQTAFIFNYAGAPWLTQYWNRTVIDSDYSNLTPEFGYNGDEDQGLMGSLNVLMKMGLFQMKGGCETDPAYEITGPLFNKITIRLNPAYYKSKIFTITAKNNSSVHKYIRSATLGGKKLTKFFFRHSDINAGSALVLQMDSVPNKFWGIRH